MPGSAVPTTSRMQIILGKSLLCAFFGLSSAAGLLAADRALADSQPEAVSCQATAAAYADRNAAPANLNDSAIAWGIEGAIVGGLTGRGSDRDGWSRRGAKRGARAGAALGVVDALGSLDPADWQALYDEAYDACLAGASLRDAQTGTPCPSTATVIEGGRSLDTGGRYSAGSRSATGCR